MKNNELKPVYDLLKTLPLVKIDADRISRIFDLMYTIKRKHEVYQKQRDSIFISYGIDLSDATHAQDVYQSHSKFVEITQEITALDKGESDIVGQSVLTRQELFACVAAANSATLSYVELLLPVIVCEIPAE